MANETTGVPISSLPSLDKLTGEELLEVLSKTAEGMEATPSGLSNFKVKLQILIDIVSAKSAQEAEALRNDLGTIITEMTNTTDARENQKLEALSKAIDAKLEGYAKNVEFDGIRIAGNKTTEAELPDPKDAKKGDIWVIDHHFWVLSDSKWKDLGDFSGKQGDNAFDIAKQNGFTGTREEWLASLRGSDGIGLKILGSMASPSGLPMAASNTNGDAYIIQEKMYVWDGTQWSVVGQVGPEGKSAYASATALGFKGTEREWLASLQGKSVYQIAVSNGYTGTEAEYLTTLKGDTGPKGDTGAKGEKGDKGDPAYAVHVLGKVTAQSDLPASSAVGDGYFVDRNLFVWDGTRWMDLGTIQGEAGHSAYQIAVGNGFQGSETEWLASLKGKDGEQGPKGEKGDRGDKGDVGLSAYELAQKSGFTGDYAAYQASLVGPAGPTLTPKGQVATVADLPTTDQRLNDLYSVAENSLCYAWDGARWVSLGSFTGPKGADGAQGPKGDAGPQGEKGEKGDPGKDGKDGAKGADGAKGDPGTGLAIDGSVDSADKLPASATEGHGYMVGDHLYIFTNSAWKDAGSIRGPAGADGIQGKDGKDGAQGVKGDKGDKGEQGNVWIVLKREPQVTDGQPGDYYFDMSTQKTYLKSSTTTWSYLGNIGGGNVYDTATDGKGYFRKDGDWVTTTLFDTPTDEGKYVYSAKAGWIRFGDYDLTVTKTDGVCDVSQSNVFYFDGAKQTTVTFNNLPAGRAKVLVCVFEGGGGSASWTNSISWQNNDKPVLATKRTNIVLLWDGFNLTGNTAHKIN